MLVDTHCHLTDPIFNNIEEVLQKANTAKVRKVIIPSTSVEDAKNALQIAEKYKQFCLAGIHPGELSKGKKVEELRKIIESSSRVVGIGEIGLDFYQDKEKVTIKEQVDLFREQVELAMESDLPVAIHMRNAEEEMKNELMAMKAIPRGQFHCFAGTQDFLETVLRLGFYISFCGNITYKSAVNLRELLVKVPENRLLLETDSPYLPPEPLRGTVNTPANVKITAEFVAKMLGTTIEKLANSTTENAKCLYSLDI